MPSPPPTFNPGRFDFKVGEAVDYYLPIDGKRTIYDIIPATVLRVNKWKLLLKLSRPVKGKTERLVYKDGCTPRSYGMDEVEG